MEEPADTSHGVSREDLSFGTVTAGASMVSNGEDAVAGTSAEPTEEPLSSAAAMVPRRTSGRSTRVRIPPELLETESANPTSAGPQSAGLRTSSRGKRGLSRRQGRAASSSGPGTSPNKAHQSPRSKVNAVSQPLDLSVLVTSADWAEIADDFYSLESRSIEEHLHAVFAIYNLDGFIVSSDPEKHQANAAMRNPFVLFWASVLPYLAGPREALQRFQAWYSKTVLQLEEATRRAASQTEAAVAAHRRVVADNHQKQRRVCQYVGLQNLGATCYMNAYLQTLFMNPHVRRAVFQSGGFGENKKAKPEIDTSGTPGNPKLPPGGALGRSTDREILYDESATAPDGGTVDNTGLEDSSSSLNGSRPGTTASFAMDTKAPQIVDAIRQLFEHLHKGTSFVADPKRIAKTLTLQTYRQEDATEFATLLLTALQTHLKGEFQRDPVADLFGGRQRQSVNCGICGALSERVDDFYELRVQVPEEPPNVSSDSGDESSRSGEESGSERSDEGAADDGSENEDEDAEEEEENIVPDLVEDADEEEEEGHYVVLEEGGSGLAVSGLSAEEMAENNDASRSSATSAVADESASRKTALEKGTDEEDDEEEDVGDGPLSGTDRASADEESPNSVFSDGEDEEAELERLPAFLEGVLGQLFRKERLDNDNAYFCERCTKKVPFAVRQIAADRFPPYLHVCFERYAYTGGERRKLMTEVDFPVILNLKALRSKATQPNLRPTQRQAESELYDVSPTDEYELIAVLEHHGESAQSGHYAAKIKDLCYAQVKEAEKAAAEAPPDNFIDDTVDVPTTADATGAYLAVADAPAEVAVNARFAELLPEGFRPLQEEELHGTELLRGFTLQRSESMGWVLGAPPQPAAVPAAPRTTSSAGGNRRQAAATSAASGPPVGVPRKRGRPPGPPKLQETKANTDIKKPRSGGITHNHLSTGGSLSMDDVGGRFQKEAGGGFSQQQWHMDPRVVYFNQLMQQQYPYSGYAWNQSAASYSAYIQYMAQHMQLQQLQQMQHQQQQQRPAKEQQPVGTVSGTALATAVGSQQQHSLINEEFGSGTGQSAAIANRGPPEMASPLPENCAAEGGLIGDAGGGGTMVRTLSAGSQSSSNGVSAMQSAQPRVTPWAAQFAAMTPEQQASLSFSQQQAAAASFAAGMYSAPTAATSSQQGLLPGFGYPAVFSGFSPTAAALLPQQQQMTPLVMQQRQQSKENELSSAEQQQSSSRGRIHEDGPDGVVSSSPLDEQQTMLSEAVPSYEAVGSGDPHHIESSVVEPLSGPGAILGPNGPQLKNNNRRPSEEGFGLRGGEMEADDARSEADEEEVLETGRGSGGTSSRPRRSTRARRLVAAAEPLDDDSPVADKETTTHRKRKKATMTTATTDDDAAAPALTAARRSASPGGAARKAAALQQEEKEDEEAKVPAGSSPGVFWDWVLYDDSTVSEWDMTSDLSTARLSRYHNPGCPLKLNKRCTRLKSRTAYMLIYRNRRLRPVAENELEPAKLETEYHTAAAVKNEAIATGNDYNSRKHHLGSGGTSLSQQQQRLSEAGRLERLVTHVEAISSHRSADINAIANAVRLISSAAELRRQECAQRLDYLRTWSEVTTHYSFIPTSWWYPFTHGTDVSTALRLLPPDLYAVPDEQEPACMAAVTDVASATISPSSKDYPPDMIDYSHLLCPHYDPISFQEQVNDRRRRQSAAAATAAVHHNMPAPQQQSADLEGGLRFAGGGIRPSAVLRGEVKLIPTDLFSVICSRYGLRTSLLSASTTDAICLECASVTRAIADLLFQERQILLDIDGFLRHTIPLRGPSPLPPNWPLKSLNSLGGSSSAGAARQVSTASAGRTTNTADEESAAASSAAPSSQQQQLGRGYSGGRLTASGAGSSSGVQPQKFGFNASTESNLPAGGAAATDDPSMSALVMINRQELYAYASTFRAHHCTKRQPLGIYDYHNAVDDAEHLLDATRQDTVLQPEAAGYDLPDSAAVSTSFDLAANVLCSHGNPYPALPNSSSVVIPLSRLRRLLQLVSRRCALVAREAAAAARHGGRAATYTGPRNPLSFSSSLPVIYRWQVDQTGRITPLVPSVLVPCAKLGDDSGLIPPSGFLGAASAMEDDGVVRDDCPVPEDSFFCSECCALNRQIQERRKAWIDRAVAFRESLATPLVRRALRLTRVSLDKRTGNHWTMQPGRHYLVSSIWLDRVLEHLEQLDENLVGPGALTLAALRADEGKCTHHHREGISDALLPVLACSPLSFLAGPGALTLHPRDCPRLPESPRLCTLVFEDDYRQLKAAFGAEGPAAYVSVVRYDDNTVRYALEGAICCEACARREWLSPGGIAAPLQPQTIKLRPYVAASTAPSVAPAATNEEAGVTATATAVAAAAPQTRTSSRVAVHITAGATVDDVIKEAAAQYSGGRKVARAWIEGPLIAPYCDSRFAIAASECFGDPATISSVMAWARAELTSFPPEARLGADLGLFLQPEDNWVLYVQYA